MLGVARVAKPAARQVTKLGDVVSVEALIPKWNRLEKLFSHLNAGLASTQFALRAPR